MIAFIISVLLLALMCATEHTTSQATSAAPVSSSILEWVLSENISSWYNSFDLCMLQFNSSNITIDEMTDQCSAATAGSKEVVRPVRCRAGNAWPLHSGYCSPFDLPFSERVNFRKAVKGYDDPEQKPLRDLFQRLQNERGALLLIGDSVMQQFFGAVACELEREKVWNDPKHFKNTDEIRYIMPNASGSPADNLPGSVPVRFVPIFHFIDGRYDRRKNASMHHLNTSIDHFLNDYDSLMVLFNVGLHYVGGTIKDFTRLDFQNHLGMALSYLQGVVYSRPDKKIRILWRETNAQHFPTPNGYWPGMRYANNLKIGCVAINDTSDDANWRNTDVERIIRNQRLTKIRIVRFYNLTVPMWTEHVNGNLKDCTHLCWTPMLYQSVFRAMADAMLEEP